MRIRKSFLLFVFLVASLLAWRGRTWHDRLLMAWSTLREAPAASDVTIGHTYVLGAEWLRFPIPHRADALRVLTNATMRRPLPPPDYTDVRPGWRYQIEYRLVDDEGNVLRQATHHSRATIVQYLTPDSPEPVTASHFNDPDLVPASSRHLHVPLQRLSQTVRHLHIRLVAADPEIEDVVVRLAGHAERRGYDDPDLWQRLSSWRKVRLCRAVIYPPELLSLQQRQEVMRWQWLPVAPFGVEGHDYQRRVLFSKNDLQGVELESDYAPAGVVLHPGMRSVIRLPEIVGRVSIVARPVAPAIFASLQLTSSSSGQQPSVKTQPRQVTVQWFDMRNQLRVSRQLTIRDQKTPDLQNDQSVSTEIAVEAGWLEITTTEPVSTRLFWQDDAASDDPREFTPQPDILRVYPCNEQELRFDTEHVGDEPTPLRLTARQMLIGSSLSPSVGGLRWSFVDARGATIRSDVMALPDQPTEFDTASFRDPHARITDPVELFWQVPPEAKQFVVAAAAGHPLVNVAIRPIRLPQQARVGTQGLAGLDQPESPPLRAWFPLRPHNHRELVKHQKTTIIQLGDRPPEVNSDVLAGNFRWDDFQPDGDWSGRFLLLPRIQDGQVRDEALANVYFELPLGERSFVQILSETDQPVSLSCVVVVDESIESNTTVQLDDVVVATMSGTAVQASLTIPDVTSGLHHVRIDGPASARVFLNHTERPSSARCLRRLGIEVGSSAQTFRIEKLSAEPELLMLDVFFIDKGDVAESVVLRADLLADDRPGVPELLPLSAWKSTSWEYFIDPPEATLPRGYVLGTSSQRVAVGRRCFLWLGENVRPGDHALKIETDWEEPVYVVLSRVIPGEFPRRKIHRVR